MINVIILNMYSSMFYLLVANDVVYLCGGVWGKKILLLTRLINKSSSRMMVTPMSCRMPFVHDYVEIR